MRINDPVDSSWGDSETLGRMVTRDEVIGTLLERPILRATEFVIAHDDRVSEHLR